MRLVPDWRKCLQWYSVRGLALIAILPVAWVSLPEDAKAMVPEDWKPWILFGIAIATIVGRLKDQQPGE